MKKQYIHAGLTDEVSELEAKNSEIAYNAALEGIVLLKNDGVLPLKEKKVALYGNGAKYTIKGGTGSGEVNERHSVSIYEGMIESGYLISSLKWLDQFDKVYEDAYIAHKSKKMKLTSITEWMANFFMPPYTMEIKDEHIHKDTEVAVYVASRQAGEGVDKRLDNDEFDLTDLEKKNIKFLSENYKSVVLVINSGSFMNLSVIDECNVSAVIYYSQQGQMGGKAFADLLSGEKSFSGKLSDSWVYDYKDVIYGDEFSYINKDLDNEFYKEGIYVGYRYYDTFDVDVRYHFGYGLTYSSFLQEVKDFRLNGKNVELDVLVTNDGNYKGKEVVEVYVTCPLGKLDKEFQRLVGFAKTSELNPGDSELVSVSFDMGYASSYDSDTARYVLEAGDYIIRVGNASNNTAISGMVHVDQELIVSNNKNICPVNKPFTELKCELTDRPMPMIYVPTLTLESYPTEQYQYGSYERYSDEKVDAILNSLTTEEKVDVLVGSGMTGMFDSSYNYTPGAVGRTTSNLIKKGLINVNLADGPAGLRLLKKSALTRSGKMKMVEGNYLMGLMANLPKPIIGLLSSKSDKDKMLYQFTTAFPVGTALAQSFNQNLCQSIGEAVSREMKKYGITYWLAPGMNIHKNPLCGRNFEYYSEDPVLTGKIAAALCRGINSVSGNYSTIKHFACNNSEQNRNFSDSVISERALREIYLKGFEIAVKEGNSKSLMTSYNKINGVYAPNSYDLNTTVLREEWGFDGVVMTDWFSTQKGQGRSDLAIKAGNDMIMPGGKSYAKEILEGLKNNVITIEDIDKACSNIIRSVVYSYANEKLNGVFTKK